MSSAIGWLIEGSGSGLQHVMLMVVRITMLLALAWTAHFAWRHANPQLRVLLWRATAAGLFLVLVLGALAVNCNLPVLPAAATDSPAPSMASATVDQADVRTANLLAGTQATEDSHVVESRQATAVGSQPWQRPERERSGTPTPRELAAAGTVESLVNPVVGGQFQDAGYWSHMNLGSLHLLLAVWTVGVVAVSASWLPGIVKLVVLFRKALPVPSAIEEQALQIAVGLSYAGHIDIRHTKDVQTPCNVGAWKPRILIPSRQCEPSQRTELHASLAHEIAHCRRHDLRWNHLLTLLQALLWFHPFAWRMRLAHTDACDEVSDITAARYVGDQELYGRLLATIALRIAGRQPATALAMARRPQVLVRIDAIARNIARAELGRRMAFSLITCIAAAAVVLGTVALSRTEASEESDIDTSDKIQHLHSTAQGTQDSVRTAYVRFRKTFMTGPFKQNMTPETCAAAFARYDMVSQPDDLRGFVSELLDLDQLAGERRNRMSQTPWSNVELHYAKDESGNERIRETRHRVDGAPDIHVIDKDVSVRWDDANSQMNIAARRDNRYAYTRLSDFWQPIMTAAQIRESGASVSEVGDQLVVEANALADSFLATVDADTGFLQTMVRVRSGRSYRSQWSGWRARSSGVVFPSVIVNLDFADNELKTIKIAIVEDARFNTPIPDTVFRLGIPAGSVIVDSRGGERKRVVKVNRDVFDAVTWQDVDDALKPIEVPLTPAEKDAIGKLKSHYVLSEDELLKRFAPPFPLERKYMPRLLQPNKLYAERKGPRYDILQWRDGEIADTFIHRGAAPSVLQLIARLTRHPVTDVEIPEEVLNRRIVGDFLYRPDADPQAMANALAKILSDEIGRPIELMFHDVERKVYVATGKLVIDEAIVRQREGRPLIMVNGGDHSGDHGETIGFGELPRFLDELAEYIDLKIIDETEHDETRLSWSQRWYDLNSTPVAKRFHLDSTKVLNSVEKQTGIRFAEEKMVVRVLRLKQ